MYGIRVDRSQLCRKHLDYDAVGGVLFASSMHIFLFSIVSAGILPLQARAGPVTPH